MKHLKMIGLVAASLAAMMAIGAASASASAKVCSTSGTGAACGGSKAYTGEFVATSSKVTLTTTSPDNWTTTCTESMLKGITNGEPGTGAITALSFGSCSSAFCTLLDGKIVATASVPAAGWAATATTGGEAAPNGFMDVKINGAAHKITCFNKAGTVVTSNCEYTAAEPQLTIKGGTPAALIATNVPLTKSAGPEGTCGTGGDWSATYEVTKPTNLTIE
jgi:ribosomal protein S27E